MLAWSFGGKVMNRKEREAKVRELAAPYGLADAPWDYFNTRPAQHQCVVIVGQYIYGKPVLEAAQYDGINFFGWLGGRHNQETWAWLDAETARKLATKEVPNLLKQHRR
jgi:hypothetical protein